MSTLDIEVSISDNIELVGKFLKLKKALTKRSKSSPKGKNKGLK
jgi:hypothetical protein